jgi:PHD/YefM family antitoxin component YafN of YafNO toxin-antitoxin module
MAKAEARYVVDDTGRKVSVILPVSDYEELLEDLSDLAVVAERRDEPAVEHDAVKARM